MSSAKKIKANRSNALASTGPKTAEGRTRAAQNAWRHGLSLSILADPVLSAEAENLAGEIAGEGATPEVLELARRIAEAQLDLQRVRYARHQFLSDQVRVKVGAISKPPRDSTPENPVTNKMQFGFSATQGADKLALILPQHAKHLLVVERYERRALSRRKFAIREFDAARQALA